MLEYHNKYLVIDLVKHIRFVSTLKSVSENGEGMHVRKEATKHNDLIDLFAIFMFKPRYDIRRPILIQRVFSTHLDLHSGGSNGSPK